MNFSNLTRVLSANFLNKNNNFNRKFHLISAIMSNKCKIAICQVTSTNDKDNCVKICSDLILKAKENGAKMVFLPESFDYIELTKEASAAKAESLDDSLIKSFRKLANENSIWLSLGGYHRKVIENNEPKIYNSHVIIDDLGEIRHIYNKIHLFEVYLKAQNTVMREADFTTHGKEFPLPVETPVGMMGTLTCYDLRFPQQSTLLRKLGAKVLTYPSGFTKVTGEAHWHALLRARAIENQCYVIAAAQSGKHNEKRTSFGHSLVVDPWGKILLDMGETSPHVEVIEIDLDYVNEVRLNMPVVNSYRNDLYTLVPSLKMPIDKPFYTFGHVQLPNNTIFFETQHSIGVVNIKPIVKGHTMIIPKVLRKRVYEMSEDEIVDLFLTGRIVAAKLENYLGCTSMNFGIQDGAEAGQSVKHVHLHLLPRKKNDFKRNDEIYDRLRDHDKDMSTGLRTNEEMALEASEFRKLFGYS